MVLPITKISKYFKPNTAIETFLEYDQEIKDLVDYLKDRVYINLAWGNPNTPNFAKKWDQGTYDYIIWPHRISYDGRFVILVIDVKEQKAYLHTPSKGGDAKIEAEDVKNYLKDLKGFPKNAKTGKPDITIDLGNTNIGVNEFEKTDYVSILYVIHILRHIKKGTYNGRVDTSRWDFPNDKPNASDSRSPFDIIAERYNKIKQDFLHLPNLDDLSSVSEEELNKKKEELKEEKRKYGEEKTKYENERSDFENEKVKYEDKKKELQEETEKYENEKAKYHDEKDALTKEQEKHAQDKLKLENEKKKYEDEKADYDRERDKHEQYKKDLEKWTGEFGDETPQDIRKKLNAIGDNNQIIKDLKKEKEKAEKDKDKAEKDAEKHLKDLTKKEKELKEEKEARSKAEDDAYNTTNDNERLKDKIAENERKIKDLENNNDTIKDLNTQIAVKDKKIAVMLEAIGKLVEEINTLSHKLHDALSKLNKSGTIQKPISSKPKSLNNVSDGGFTDEKLQEIKDKQQKQYKFKFNSVLSAEILDKLLSKAKKAVNKPKPSGDKNLEDFLTGKENKEILGYRVEDEPLTEIKVEGKLEEWEGKDIIAKETEWQQSNQYIENRGKLLLPFFYKKNNFDPDNLTDDNFCSFEVIRGKKRLKQVNGAIQGALSMAPSIGKTTKTVYELYHTAKKGEKQNIILVAPTTELVQSAYDNHSNPDFLQDPNYKCVYHGIAHGIYPHKLNDLTQWKDGEGKISGKAGVSILHYTHLLHFIARDLLDVSKITIDSSSKEKARIEKGLKNVKNKLITDDTIFIFDEAHFTKKASYQQLFKELVYLESEADKTKPAKKVILMSATFKNKPFSITTSYPVESWEVDEFSSDTKFTDKRYKDFDKKLANSQTLLFADSPYKTLNLTAIKNKIPHVIFDESNNNLAEKISQGIPKGGLMIVSSDLRIGVNLKCQVIVDTARVEVENIKGRWGKEVIDQAYNEADLSQGRGRGGRSENAWYYTLSTIIEDAGEKANVLSYIVKAVFGDASDLKKDYFKTFEASKLAEVFKASFAFEDKKGISPEALFIGLVPNISGINNFPSWKEEMPSGCDEGLWKQFLGTYEPPKLSQQDAENTLFLMIDAKLSQIRDLTAIFTMKLKNPLVKQAGLKINDEESNKKLRSILNKVVEKQLENLEDYDPDELTYTNNETFNKITGLYKMLDRVEISVLEVKNSKGIVDKDWVINFNHIII